VNFSRTYNSSDPSQGALVNPIELQPALVAVPGVVSRKRQEQQKPGLGTFANGPTSYSKPNNRVSSVILESAYTGQIVQTPSPCGDNCTFTQSFVGPAYQCVDKDPYDMESPWCYGGSCGTVFDYSPDLHEATFYLASNSSRDFCTNLTSNSAACGLIDDTTEAWDDGNIWVWYSYLPEEWKARYPNLTDLQNANVSIPGGAWQNYSTCAPKIDFLSDRLADCDIQLL
jgi:hypothetical protein